MTLDEQIAHDEARARWFVVRGRPGHRRRLASTWGWKWTDYFGDSYMDWTDGYAERSDAAHLLARARKEGLDVEGARFVRMLPPGTRARRLERALRNLVAADHPFDWADATEAAKRLLRAAEKRRQR